MDTHFHYYATYLAARLAGMHSRHAQSLAYYCISLAEMHAGSDSLIPWQFQGSLFFPCVTGIETKNPSITQSTHYGEYHCELAFRQLPALEKHIQLTKQPKALKNRYLQRVGPTAAISQYNPLTDIDWQGSHNKNLGFLQKNVTPPSSQTSLSASWRNDAASRLHCRANSAFSQQMFNDVIDTPEYKTKAQGFELALLGCHLFVYQNTWRYEIQTLNDNQIINREKKRLDAFFWTYFAVHCYLKKSPLSASTPNLALYCLQNTRSLINTLQQLFSLDDEPLRIEYYWLNSIPALLQDNNQRHSITFDNWQEGLRLRPNYLLDQAMLAANTTEKRQIISLNGFKNFGFFKLNKAAEYHTQWVANQFYKHHLRNYDTTQCVGRHDKWCL